MDAGSEDICIELTLTWSMALVEVSWDTDGLYDTVLQSLDKTRARTYLTNTDRIL